MDQPLPNAVPTSPDPNPPPVPDDASTPYLSERQEQPATQTGPVPPTRVEANTAFLRLSQAAGQAELDSQFEMDDEDMTPPPMGDDLENTEAASARIAQEYRRQVRIKRLADEIKQAEKEKKEIEKKRRAELDLKTPGTPKRKEETAKLSLDALGINAQETETQARKRIAAMSAFKAGTVIIHKGKTGRWIIAASVAVLVLMSFGGWKLLDYLADQRKREHAREVANQIKAKEEAAFQAVQAARLREAEIQKQKIADAEAAKKAEAEKRRAEEQMRVQHEAELKRIKEEENEHRLAEEKRVREENERLAERAKIEQEALRKKVEEAQRIAREKLKAEQEAEAKAAALAKAEAAKTETKPDAVKPDGVKPEVVKPEIKKPDGAEIVKPDVVKNDLPKNGVKETPKPETPKPTPVVGNVRTIPSDPPQIPDKLDLPSGGVRLYVKASDPYGGALTFQWKQLKGTQVDISDPTAAKFRDGKWHSQTFFVAREAGAYEFEVIVKNDEGVETRKRFPIEVLPPTTLK